MSSANENTSALVEKGNYHFAYGLDGILRIFGDDYLTIKLNGHRILKMM
ncbi:hypothetical protein GWO43_00950 [candidate division KSB1 bacterium]|nr:hypothetical protein [candidate division KSB1 bacterium]NIR69100.1 hypothetical protein [candidate division KSB1 bacterium]NIS22631.1 hypothetical protein [candidate division KSB1 bacterium]NIT69489.1 hypothetical protein [candidate division KSB1 bacterium]NIU23142.1 hypothetical protein [candidate division KSB1 bacterium]